MTSPRARRWPAALRLVGEERVDHRAAGCVERLDPPPAGGIGHGLAVPWWNTERRTGGVPAATTRAGGPSGSAGGRRPASGHGSRGRRYRGRCGRGPARPGRRGRAASRSRRRRPGHRRRRRPMGGAHAIAPSERGRVGPARRSTIRRRHQLGDDVRRRRPSREEARAARVCQRCADDLQAGDGVRPARCRTRPAASRTGTCSQGSARSVPGGPDARCGCPSRRRSSSWWPGHPRPVPAGGRIRRGVCRPSARTWSSTRSRNRARRRRRRGGPGGRRRSAPVRPSAGQPPGEAHTARLRVARSSSRAFSRPGVADELHRRLVRRGGGVRDAVEPAVQGAQRGHPPVARHARGRLRARRVCLPTASRTSRPAAASSSATWTPLADAPTTRTPPSGRCAGRR